MTSYLSRIECFKSDLPQYYLPTDTSISGDIFSKFADRVKEYSLISTDVGADLEVSFRDHLHDELEKKAVSTVKFIIDHMLILIFISYQSSR